MKTKKKCLFDGCNRVEKSRGLCINHYTAALRLVQSNKTSWDQLEASGRSAPKVRKDVSQWFLKGGSK